MSATGRPPSTSHAEIEAAAFGLFEQRDFEATSIEEIAAAVGIGRRTIFRYFPSKNDIVWGDFEWVNRRLRRHLEESGPEVPLMEALRRAAVRSNSYPEEELPALRQRLTLITTVPALQAHSMLRYASWRAVVAEWAAARRGEAPDDAFPQVLSHVALGASISAFTRWVQHPGEDLERCLDDGYRLIATGFDESGTPSR